VRQLATAQGPQQVWPVHLYPTCSPPVSQEFKSTNLREEIENNSFTPHLRTKEERRHGYRKSFVAEAEAEADTYTDADTDTGSESRSAIGDDFR